MALWTLAGVAASWFANGVSDGTLAWWLATLILLYFFLPPIITGIAADEARNQFGQKNIGTRIARIPMFAGVGLGLLLASCWPGNVFSCTTAILGLVSCTCALVTLPVARAGVRNTREQLATVAALSCLAGISLGVSRNGG